MLPTIGSSQSKAADQIHLTMGADMRKKMSLLAGVCVAAVSLPAFAQEATTAQASDDTTEAIIVTGSRIKSSFEQPTPVAIKTAEMLQQAQPIGIAEALVQSPQFSNSAGPRSNALFAPGAQQGNFLNLRGLGSSRTLILVDGDRVPPTSFDGQVNVDIIPELLVSRVDVVTAGVSAVYGSDAVSGVVNYVLNNKFTGVKLLAQTGMSTYGDGLSYRLGGAAGTGFAGGRGHFVLSVEHRSDGEVQHQDRPETAPQYAFAGLGATTDANLPGTAAFPFTVVQNVNWRTLTPFPGFVSGPFAGRTFDSAGNLIPVDRGTYVSAVGQIGGSGTLVDPTRTLLSGTTSTRVFGRASFDVTDGITAFVQGVYSQSRTPVASAINFGLFLPRQGNPFLPATAQLPAFVPAGTPLGAALIFPGQPDFGPPNSVETNKFWSVKAGFEGSLGASWDFRAVYQHGSVKQRIISREVNQQRIAAALDVVSVAGVPTCYITTVNPTALPGCVPYNPYRAGGNAGNLAALKSFILGDSINNVTNKMDTFSFNISGTPFALPAGDVSVASNFEYRSNSLVRTSNSDPAIPFSTFGGAIRDAVLLGTTNNFNISNIGVINGSNNVKEASLEVLVPITNEASPIGALAVSGAGRWTDYSTSGTVYTWKAGATWEPIEQIRFRGTRSRDIRAPNLFELFAGATSGLLNYVPPPPFAQTSDTRGVRGGGNPNLKPEVADTLSFGVVLNPVSNLNLSVDYYDISLKDAIQARSNTDILVDCATTGFTSAACSNITLVGGGNPTPALLNSAPDIASVFAGPINLASLQTRGIDIDANYSLPMSSGQLTLRANANILLSYKSKAGPTNATVEQAGYIDVSRSLLLQNAIQPELRGTFSANYKSNGGFGAFIQGRYIGSLKQGEVPGLTAGSQTFVFADKKIGAVWYFDANISQTIEAGPLGSELELFANVTNLFNRRPPIIPSDQNPTNSFPTYPNLYDIMGRFVTVGARVKF